MPDLRKLQNYITLRMCQISKLVKKSYYLLGTSILPNKVFDHPLTILLLSHLADSPV